MSHLSPQLQHGIRRLLSRATNPWVKVASSQLQGAGRGVFAAVPIPQGTPVCLYPGIFSPGLPLGAAFADDATVFLGSASLPSGVHPPEKNAYIMNLKDVGGYIDGLATEGLVDDDDHNYNSHAVAHLVNHSSQESNVKVGSFWWHEILHQTCNDENNGKDESLYNIPNKRRCDGTPWFFSTLNNEMTFHEETNPCAGAVFCAARDLVQHEEIYLHYALKEPLPEWAKGWYNG